MNKSGIFLSDTLLLVWCGRLCASMKVINAQSWLQRDNNILWHFLSYIMLCSPFLIKQIFAKERTTCTYFPHLTQLSRISCEKSNISTTSLKVAAEICVSVVVLYANLLALFSVKLLKCYLNFKILEFYLWYP